MSRTPDTLQNSSADSQNLETTSMVVDHVRHPLALMIRSVLEKEGRKHLNKMLIDDEENIIQAIQAQIKLDNIFTTDRQALSPEFLSQLPADVPLIDVSKRTGKKIFGNDKISRTFALAVIPEPLSKDFLLQLNKDIIVLDRLAISGNIGAIVRTAVALGAGAVVILDTDPVDLSDRRLIRSSRGYIFKIPILTVDTPDFIRLCVDNSIKLLATTAHAEVEIQEAAQHQGKLAIVFGSEKEGCSKALLDAADILTKIPINFEVDSLNVSAAASIVLYLRSQYYRQFENK